MIDDALSIIGVIALGWAAIGVLGWTFAIVRYGYEGAEDFVMLPACALLGPFMWLLLRGDL